MPKTTNSFVEEWVEKFKYYRPYCNPNVLDGRTILIQEYAINFLRTALLESEKRVREETVREILALNKGKRLLISPTEIIDYASSKGIDLTK